MVTKHELEIALELRCVATTEARGGVALKLRPPTGKGFPDRLVFHPAVHVFAAEFKRQKTGVASVQQKRWADDLALVGVTVYFIDSDEQFEAAWQKERVR